MSQQLINHSPDLKRLKDEGYEIEVKGGGFLIIHHIPYIASDRSIKYGSLVSELTLAHGTRTAKPNTHVIGFIGEHPCNKNGTHIAGIKHSSNDERLRPDLIVNHRFSNKPPNGYNDYYEKFTRYIDIISAPARSVNPKVSAITFNPVLETADDSVFQYHDTNSSRAKVSILTERFKGMKIAIIGLGGTGSYILDLLSKTPVLEIHLFDGDDFLQHNAFRAPGAASSEVLKRGLTKAQYLYEKYSNLHKGIIPHPEYITLDNIYLLQDMTFVFIAVDSNTAREEISNALLVKGISFIDVGLGINTVDDQLIGSVRVTAATLAKNDHLGNRLPVVENDNNDYAPNIQIAELNALNAVMAVIKWKKLCGFYQDLEREHHSTYSLNVSELYNEDHTA